LSLKIREEVLRAFLEVDHGEVHPVLVGHEAGDAFAVGENVSDAIDGAGKRCGPAVPSRAEWLVAPAHSRLGAA